MAWIYRYIDLADGTIKNVGIVWGPTRTLQDRVNEHKKDFWYQGKQWRIEYITENIDNRSEAEAFESHYIALYNPCYNVSKVGWGLNKYLPDRENDWIVYNPDDFIIPKKKKTNKKEKGKTLKKQVICEEKSEDFFVKNEKSIRIIEYIFSKILNTEFYLSQLYKNDFNRSKRFRLDYSIMIKAPSWFDDMKKMEGTFIEFNHKSRFEFISIVPTLWFVENEGLYFVLDINSISTHSIFYVIDEIYEIACEIFGDDVPQNIKDLMGNRDYLINHWDEIVDVNSPSLYKAPPEDRGKNIIRLKDEIAKKNNSYFEQWYIGCSLIYTDGGGFYFYKNGKFSKYVANYDNAIMRECYFENGHYSLEEHINYYLAYWAIELDKVLWVTSLGAVFCGDDIYYFEESDDMYKDIENALDIVNTNNLRPGTGTKHE